jgi:hypothetical protein
MGKGKTFFINGIQRIRFLDCEVLPVDTLKVERISEGPKWILVELFKGLEPLKSLGCGLRIDSLNL